MDFLADFEIFNEKLFKACGLKCSSPVAEAESSEYQAHTFSVDKKSVRYRLAKVTPTKVGQFVTLWKRIGSSVIQPFESTDDLDFFVVTVKFRGRLGQFVFPKAILIQQDILSVDSKGGKRGIRVYPAWDKVESKQALKTQKWQLEYFFEISESVNLERVKRLYSF